MRQEVFCIFARHSAVETIGIGRRARMMVRDLEQWLPRVNRGAVEKPFAVIDRPTREIALAKRFGVWWPYPAEDLSGHRERNAEIACHLRRPGSGGEHELGSAMGRSIGHHRDAASIDRPGPDRFVIADHGAPPRGLARHFDDRLLTEQISTLRLEHSREPFGQPEHRIPSADLVAVETLVGKCMLPCRRQRSGDQGSVRGTRVQRAGPGEHRPAGRGVELVP